MAENVSRERIAHTVGGANGASAVITNAERDKLDRDVPLEYAGFLGGSQKHQLYKDFGYPTLLTSDLIRALYQRSPLAKAAVAHTLRRCWLDIPMLRRTDDELDAQEEALQAVFERSNFWQRFQDADRMSLIGTYAALIIRLKDNKSLSEPVETVPNGIEGLEEIIPAWDTEIKPKTIVTDPTDKENYGKVVMYEFIEYDVTNKRLRTIDIHPSRVIIVSPDGTEKNRSPLESGFNALVDIEKVRGAASEALYKNSRMGLHMNVIGESELDDDAEPQGFDGPDAEEGETFAEKITKQLDKFNAKYENMIVTENMESTVLNTSMSGSEHVMRNNIMDFAASFQIPFRILIGSQSGERAASEDALEWARTCQARRVNMLQPIIRKFIDRFIEWKMIDGSESKPWRIDWQSLTEATAAEQEARAKIMNESNSQAWTAGKRVTFTRDEVREALGFKPLTDEQEQAELDKMQIMDDGDDPFNDDETPTEKPKGKENG